MSKVRSIESLQDSPNEKWTRAEVSRIRDRRLQTEAEVKVPPGPQPASLLISRPFFPGYVAHLDGKPLEVTSYRGLVPLIKVPPGAHGRLTISYRPAWLIWGSAIAIVCALGWLLGIGSALRAR